MEKELQERLAGVLPTISVLDKTYIIDWRFKELRMKDEPYTSISLKNAPMDAEGKHYLFYYNPKNHTVVYPRVLTDLKGAVLLKIPNELGLDPVGVAREYGLGDTELLKSHPIRKDLKAEVVAPNKLKAEIWQKELPKQKLNRGLRPGRGRRR